MSNEVRKMSNEVKNLRAEVGKLRWDALDYRRRLDAKAQVISDFRRVCESYKKELSSKDAEPWLCSRFLSEIAATLVAYDGSTGHTADARKAGDIELSKGEVK